MVVDNCIRCGGMPKSNSTDRYWDGPNTYYGTVYRIFCPTCGATTRKKWRLYEAISIWNRKQEPRNIKGTLAIVGIGLSVIFIIVALLII